MAQRIRFASRTQWEPEETAYTRAVRDYAASGKPLLDLTASNPTGCGLALDESVILEPLGSLSNLVYEPTPFGLKQAREAVARYYLAHGAATDPRRIILTASTSEGYSYLFRLLCDPGDDVMVARPSYPLLDLLADLNDIRLIPYSLFYDHGWHVDMDVLARRLTSRTRAIVVVHPNNPTGQYTHQAERVKLEEFCLRNGLTLIVDEVFLDYALSGAGADPSLSFAVGPHPVPTFVLSGISKTVALPQMKAAWCVCNVPPSDAEEVEHRLEIIADTYLSLSSPVQYALPTWLNARELIQRQIRERVAKNLATLDRMLDGQDAVNRLEVEGGWYVILRLPAVRSGDELAVGLLHEKQVLTHPGHFFGMEGDGWLVTSLLLQEDEYQLAMERVLDYANQYLGS